MMQARSLAAGLLLPTMLIGCSVPGAGLVSATPQRPSPARIQMAEEDAGRVPLVTIPAATDPAAYASPLAGAIRAAEALKPDVAFDVLSAVPRQGTPLHQIMQAKALTPDAVGVSTAIMDDGVPVARISLGAVVVPGLQADEVRVYVR